MIWYCLSKSRTTFGGKMIPTEWADQKEEREKAALMEHERLSTLFREDRFRFELERKEMIAHAIASAPNEELREKLRSMQATWDRRMKSAGSAHNRYVLAQSFFWEHFHEKWHPAIKEANQVLNPPRTED
jgi:hypothetical protein